MTDGPSQDRPAHKDPIKPFHAKEVSTGQETADVVAAVLKHAAERDVAAQRKTAPKPQPIWMLPFGVMLAVFAGFLLVAPPDWVIVNRIAAQAPEEQVRNVSTAIFMHGARVQAYQQANGRLPSTLAEAGVNVEGIDYEVQGQSYLLIASVGDRDVVFNSAVESLQEWAQREAGDVSRRIGS